MIKASSFTLTVLLVGTVSSPSASLSQAETLERLVRVTQQDSGIGLASDGAARIRLAGRLGMLTQRIAASSCALTSDIAVERSYENLETSMHEIDLILDALRYGNEALGILGPEENRRLLHDIYAMETEWAATRGAVEAVLADGQDVDSAHVIDDHNLALLDLATVLEGDVLAEYSDPFSMTQADAILVKLAGRQKMMTQKMSKDACEIWTGYHAEAGRAELIETMQVFDFTIRALRHGEASYGIVPAPTPEIAKTLDKVLAGWGGIQGDLDALIAGAALDPAAQARLVTTFDAELDDLDRVVFGYKQHAKRK